MLSTIPTEFAHLRKHGSFMRIESFI